MDSGAGFTVILNLVIILYMLIGGIVRMLRGKMPGSKNMDLPEDAIKKHARTTGGLKIAFAVFWAASTFFLYKTLLDNQGAPPTPGQLALLLLFTLLAVACAVINLIMNLKIVRRR